MHDAIIYGYDGMQKYMRDTMLPYKEYKNSDLIKGFMNSIDEKDIQQLVEYCGFDRDRILDAIEDGCKRYMKEILLDPYCL